MYEEFTANQNHQIKDLEKEDQSTTIDLQPSHDHVEDVTQGASFYVGDLEVSFDKQVDEVGCTQGNSRLESLYDETYISYAHDMNSEEQSKMIL